MSRMNTLAGKRSTTLPLAALAVATLILAFLQTAPNAGATAGVAPKVSKVTPAAGPVETGTNVAPHYVHVYGSGFTGVSGVTVRGAAAATYHLISDKELVVLMPETATAGDANVIVDTDGPAMATPTRVNFKYVALPNATGFGDGDEAGPITGGTTVNVVGTGFKDIASGLGVTVAGVPVKSPRVNADGTILTFKTPPGAALGNASVVVTFPGGTDTVGNFSYRPAISKISTRTGPAAGGTKILISGKGFTGVNAVEFGGTNAASYTVLSDTEIVAVSAAGSAGKVAVSVTHATAGESVDISSDDFTFTA